jgi:hypothetical protein
MAPDVVSKLQAMVTGVPAAREQTQSEAGAGGSDPAGKVNGDSDNAYVRELQK